MYQLLYRMKERNDFKDYLINTKEAYSILKDQFVDTDEIKTGLNKSLIDEIPVFDVFVEKDTDVNLCEGGFDRYKRCVAIYDNKDNLLFFTRDPSYNKNWK